MVGKDATNTERRGERPRLEFNVNNAMHYGNILEYLSLWSEVQFLNVQNSKISKKSGNLTNLDFTPETCQKIEKK